MGWFHVAPLCRCGFVKGLSVFTVFCVITLCVGDNCCSRFHVPHPNLPVQLFELVTFRSTTSVDQHFPPLLKGCWKLTLKKFHLYHLPACLAEILTRWTPEKTTLFTSYFQLQLTFILFFFLLHHQTLLIRPSSTEQSQFPSSCSLMLHKGEKGAIYYSADKKIFQSLIYWVDFFSVPFIIVAAITGFSVLFDE